MPAQANPTETRFRTALVQSGRARCLSVRLMSDPVIAHLAAAAGFEALYVDLEHALIPPDSAARICLAAQSLGLMAMVRLGGDDRDLGQLLDAGVDGVILTGVENADQLRQRLAATRFPPHGRRSINWSTPATGYRKPDDATAFLESRPYIAVMVETPETVEQAGELAACAGVDMLFIGCGDLALSMGLGSAVGHPDIEMACRTVAAAALNHGRDFGLGGAAGQPDLARRLLDVTPTMLSGGSEQSLLAQSLYRQAEVLADI